MQKVALKVHTFYMHIKMHVHWQLYRHASVNKYQKEDMNWNIFCAAFEGPPDISKINYFTQHKTYALESHQKPPHKYKSDENTVEQTLEH